MQRRREAHTCGSPPPQQTQATFTEERLQALLTDERLRCERLKHSRDVAEVERDEALTDLAATYAELDAYRASLAESSLYVRHLKARVAELEVAQARSSAAAAARAGGAAAAAASGRGDGDGVFSVAAVKAAVQAAVAEAGRCEPEERKKRIRALQLRWHPDKAGGFLTNLAGEVTKMINEAAAAFDKQ